MNKTKSLFLVLALAIAVMYANIGGLDIYALDEAKNAEAAREMLENGDWVVPHFNYELRTDKPPLHYYLMAIGYQIFGVNAFGARFFSSLMGVLTILLTFLFTYKHFGEKPATYASLVLISSLHFALQFHMSVPDPYLVFFLTWAFFSFYEAYAHHHKWHLMAFYFAIGCGVLTKGPVALGLTGITALAFLLARKDFKWKTIWRLQPFGGVLFSLAIALPWYYLVYQKTDGVWINEFFFKHNISRFSDAMEGHQGVFLLTFVYVFFMGMLAYLPFISQSIKNWRKNNNNTASLFVLIAASVIILFFAVSSTKLPNYTVPSYPLLALLVGVYLSRLDHTWFDKLGNRIGLIIYLALLLLFPIGIYFGLQADPSLQHLRHLSLYFVPLSLGGIFMVFFGLWKKNMDRLILFNNATWLVTVILFFYVAFPVIDRENPVRKTLPHMDTSQKIIGYKRVNAAYIFALQREVKKYNTPEEVKAIMATYKSGYLISRKRYQTELEKIEGLVYLMEAKDTFENPTTLIMKWGQKGNN